MTNYQVPQRKNLKLSEVEFIGETAHVRFEDLHGEAVLKLVIETEENGSYRVESYDTPYDSLSKTIEKKELDIFWSKDTFSYEFGEVQKRLKAIIRKEATPGTPVEVERVEAEEPKEVKETPKAKKVSVKLKRPESVGLEAQLQGIVYDALESDFTTQTLQNKMVELGIEPNRTEVIVTTPKGAVKNTGVQHMEFKNILAILSAKVNLALVGPAGSGKTTSIKEVAKALDLPFYSKSVSAQTGTHEFFGYQDANGKYVRTLFREAYENGGVFLLDEFDAGNPNVLASMNQATANGECAFADGMITKHEDFVIVMAGNTFGHGATSEYVGRNAIDKATLDRFAFLYFDYDETFERSLATNKSWCEEVQRIRKNVRTKKVKAIVSPRATFDGAKLLSAGLSVEKVKELLIFKGLTKDEVNLIK